MTDQALAKIGEVVKSIIDEFHIKIQFRWSLLKIHSYSLSIKLFINSAPFCLHQFCPLRSFFEVA